MTVPGSDPRSIELEGQLVERRLDHERDQREMERSSRPVVARGPSLLARLRRLLGR